MTHRGRRAALIRCAVALGTAIAGCRTTPTFPPAAPSTGKRAAPGDAPFAPVDAFKSDIDVANEVSLRECLASARLITAKLYQRNPREWRKGPSPGPDAAVARAFDPRYRFRFADVESLRGGDAVLLALKPAYAGDRVFAFGVGLGSIVFLAYGERTSLYLTDTLDAQKLYNSARNLEIAAWKLANARDAKGSLLLLSNEMGGPASNLSFEREFGKMIATQDTAAQVAAQRTNRTIRKVVQTLATAVFLPI